MANTTQGGRRSSGNRPSTRSRQTGARQRQKRRPSQSKSSGTTSRRGTLTRPDTGYTLHSRRVRREGSSSAGLSTLLKPRVLLLVGIVLVVVIVIFVGISSCIRRGNEATSTPTEEASQPKNEQDNRVAAGVSPTMTSKFTEALDTADLLAQIAEHADQYDDDRLLTLALNEPTAVEFVAGYPTSDKSAKPYDESVRRGEVPKFFDWDSHWGAVTYGEGPLALTGSGPTTLSMAYMGLTGRTDNTPNVIAQQAEKSNYTESKSGSKTELFSKLATTLGLTTETQEISSGTLLYTIGNNTLVAVKLKEGTLTDEAHWALVVNVNEDGSVTMFDPTSSEISNHPWDPATIADASDSFYSISISEEDLEKLDSSSKSGTDSDSTSSSSSSSSSTSSSSSSRTDEDSDQDSTTSDETAEDADSDSSSSSSSSSSRRTSSSSSSRQTKSTDEGETV